METLSERLQKLINEKGTNPTRIARQAGLKQPTVARIVSGESKMPDRKNMKAIARVLGVDEQWLWDGKGPKDADTAAGYSDIGQPLNINRYPVISPVQAGAWAEVMERDEPGAWDQYELSSYEATGSAFWLKVTGDSMTSPIGVSVPEGSMILVDPGLAPSPGDFVVAKLADTNKATFKKLVEDSGEWFLRPLNAAYPTRQLPRDARIVGVVVETRLVLRAALRR